MVVPRPGWAGRPFDPRDAGGSKGVEMPKDGQIMVDDLDDELEELEDDDEADEDDEADDEDDEDEPEETPAARSRRDPGKPTYTDLLEQIKKLQATTRRNNKELAKRRVTEQWMEKHGIEDLDAWLAERGIDKETGQVKAGAASEGVANQSSSPAPATEAPPAGENNPPPLDVEREVDRRVKLELERREAQDAERLGVLEESIRNGAIEAALVKLGFSGTLSKAMMLIDLARVKVGSDGKPAGADEVAQELRTEIPEWFRRRAPLPPRTGGDSVDGGEKRQAPPAKRSWDQQVADRWRSGR